MFQNSLALLFICCGVNTIFCRMKDQKQQILQSKTAEIKININFKIALWKIWETFYLVVQTLCYFVVLSFWTNVVGFTCNWNVQWLQPKNHDLRLKTIWREEKDVFPRLCASLLSQLFLLLMDSVLGFRKKKGKMTKFSLFFRHATASFLKDQKI